VEINTENMTTRPATTADLPKLGQFLQMLVDAERPFNPTLKEGEVIYYDIEALIADEQTHVLVIEVEGEVIASGYAQVRTAKAYERHEQFGFLGFMFVSPKFRGKGVNALLLNDLKQWILSKGITELRLEVYTENVAAVSAYEKVGFEKLLTTMRCVIS
jgi:GNAT superfamily N-acetyltransferase